MHGGTGTDRTYPVRGNSAGPRLGSALATGTEGHGPRLRLRHDRLPLGPRRACGSGRVSSGSSCTRTAQVRFAEEPEERAAEGWPPVRARPRLFRRGVTTPKITIQKRSSRRRPRRRAGALGQRDRPQGVPASAVRAAASGPVPPRAGRPRRTRLRSRTSIRRPPSTAVVSVPAQPPPCSMALVTRVKSTTGGQVWAGTPRKLGRYTDSPAGTSNPRARQRNSRVVRHWPLSMDPVGTSVKTNS